MRLYFTGNTICPKVSEVWTNAYEIPSKYGFKDLNFDPLYWFRNSPLIGDVTIDDFKSMVKKAVPFGIGKNKDTVWIAHIEYNAFIDNFASPGLPSERLSQEGAKECGEQKVAYVKGIYETAEEAKAFLSENTLTVRSISELKDNIIYFHNKEFDILIGRDNAEDADKHQDVIYRGEFPNESYPLKYGDYYL